MIAAWLSAAIALMVLVLLLAEWKGQQWLAAGAKVAASTGFVALAIIHLQPGWQSLMLAGFILAAVADVLLLVKGQQRAFVVALGLFLAAHFAFATAFVWAGVKWPWFAIACIPAILPLMAVAAWLRPHVPLNLQPPVASYMVSITIMMLAAVATIPRLDNLLIPAGAALLYASDLAVARQRFVAPGFINRAWGLPAYYAGMVLLAWSLA